MLRLQKKVISFLLFIVNICYSFELDKYEVDLGLVEAGVVHNYTLNIINRGEENVRIIHMDRTDNVVPFVDYEVIGPRERLRLNLAIKPTDQEEIIWSIVDSKDRELNVNIKFRIANMGDWYVNKTEIKKTVERGESINFNLDLHPLKKGEIVGIRSNVEKVNIARIGKNSYEVNIKDIKEDLNGEILFLMDGSNTKVVRIPINVDIKREVKINPKEINLGVIRRNTGRPFSVYIENIENFPVINESNIEINEEILSIGTYIIKGMWLANYSPGIVRQEVELKVNDRVVGYITFIGRVVN